MLNIWSKLEQYYHENGSVESNIYLDEYNGITDKYSVTNKSYYSEDSHKSDTSKKYHPLMAYTFWLHKNSWNQIRLIILCIITCMFE